MALSPHAHLPLTAPSRWGCEGHCPAFLQQMSTVPCHDPPVTMSLVGNLIRSRTPDFTCSLTRSRQAPLPEVCWCQAHSSQRVRHLSYLTTFLFPKCESVMAFPITGMGWGWGLCRKHESGTGIIPLAEQSTLGKQTVAL